MVEGDALGKERTGGDKDMEIRGGVRPDVTCQWLCDILS